MSLVTTRVGARFSTGVCEAGARKSAIDYDFTLPAALAREGVAQGSRRFGRPAGREAVRPTSSTFVRDPAQSLHEHLHVFASAGFFFCAFLEGPRPRSNLAGARRTLLEKSRDIQRRVGPSVRVWRHGVCLQGRDPPRTSFSTPDSTCSRGACRLKEAAPHSTPLHGFHQPRLHEVNRSPPPPSDSDAPARLPSPLAKEPALSSRPPGNPGRRGVLRNDEVRAR